MLGDGQPAGQRAGGWRLTCSPQGGCHLGEERGGAVGRARGPRAVSPSFVHVPGGRARFHGAQGKDHRG